jgi:succinate dehydrogenase/fumarate reductase flavoprotein subunit
VLGWRAGKNASDYARSSTWLIPANRSISNQKENVLRIMGNEGGISPRNVGIKLQALMSTYGGYVRNKRGLETALRRIKHLQSDSENLFAGNEHELMEALEVQNLVLTSEMILRAALMRTESRINHFRSDFPDRDDENWLKVILISKSSAGEMNLYIDKVPGKEEI